MTLWSDQASQPSWLPTCFSACPADAGMMQPEPICVCCTSRCKVNTHLLFSPFDLLTISVPDFHFHSISFSFFIFFFEPCKWPGSCDVVQVLHLDERRPQDCFRGIVYWRCCAYSSRVHSHQRSRIPKNAQGMFQSSL